MALRSSSAAPTRSPNAAGGSPTTAAVNSGYAVRTVASGTTATRRGRQGPGSPVGEGDEVVDVLVRWPSMPIALASAARPEGLSISRSRHERACGKDLAHDQGAEPHGSVMMASCRSAGSWSAASWPTMLARVRATCSAGPLTNSLPSQRNPTGAWRTINGPSVGLGVPAAAPEGPVRVTSDEGWVPTPSRSTAKAAWPGARDQR